MSSFLITFYDPMPVEMNNIISFYVNCQMLRLGRERWGFGFRPSATFFLFSSFHELSEDDSLHSRYHNQLCLGSEYHHLHKVDRNSVTLCFISECMYLCMSTTRSLSEGVHPEFLQFYLWLVRNSSLLCACSLSCHSCIFV